MVIFFGSSTSTLQTFLTLSHGCDPPRKIISTIGGLLCYSPLLYLSSVLLKGTHLCLLVAGKLCPIEFVQKPLVHHTRVGGVALTCLTTGRVSCAWKQTCFWEHFLHEVVPLNTLAPPPSCFLIHLHSLTVRNLSACTSYVPYHFSFLISSLIVPGLVGLRMVLV